MNDQNHTSKLTHHLHLIEQFIQLLETHSHQLVDSGLDTSSLKERFKQLHALGEAKDDSFYFTGQSVLTHMFTHYPQLNRLLHRDLIWFFGGECLHFMPDHEISFYQQLDELESEAEEEGLEFNREQARELLVRFHEKHQTPH